MTKNLEATLSIEPQLVTITGDRHLLMQSGVKRGQSEAFVDCSLNLRNAARYYESQLSNLDEKDPRKATGLTMVKAFDKMADAFSDKAAVCSEESRSLLGSSLALRDRADWLTRLWRRFAKLLGR